MKGVDILKKYFLCTLIIASLLLSPIFVKAESSNQITSSSSNSQLTSKNPHIVTQTKYYKNVTVYDTSEYQTYSLNNSSNLPKAISSETIEVSEEEYLSIDPKSFQSVSINAYHTIETTYLSLTTSVGDYGDYFRYMDSFNYKIIPTVRSYDVIAIGYNDDVKPIDDTISCAFSYGIGDKSFHHESSLIKKSSTGTSCIFNLPNEEDLMNFNVLFQFRVEKVNPNGTVPSQRVVGDYRHAKEEVSFIEVSSHEVDQYSGITFPLKYEGKFQIITLPLIKWNEPW